MIYKISHLRQKKINKDTEVRNRLCYYKDNPFIIAEQLPIKLNNQEISFNTIFYDRGKGLIEINEYDRKELLNLYN